MCSVSQDSKSYPASDERDCMEGVDELGSVWGGGGHVIVTGHPHNHMTVEGSLF